MDSSKKSNKITEIVRLQQILRKWRKKANNSSSSSSTKPPPSSSSASSSSSNKKSIQLMIKRTLSFSDKTNDNNNNNDNDDTLLPNNNFYDPCHHQPTTVPKGYLAVCVGEEQKRFVIPTEYLGCQAFHVLLREAEEVFGFGQTGVLRIPCEVSVFEALLKTMHVDDHHDRKSSFTSHEQSCCYDNNEAYHCFSSSEAEMGFSYHSDHSPMCR